MKARKTKKRDVVRYDCLFAISGSGKPSPSNKLEQFTLSGVNFRNLFSREMTRFRNCENKSNKLKFLFFVIRLCHIFWDLIILLFYTCCCVRHVADYHSAV